jgi:hypothetical protein
VDDEEIISKLRHICHAADYSETAVVGALKGVRPVSLRPQDREVNLRRMKIDPLSSLIKLFLLGTSVSPAEAKEALHPLSLEQLQAQGILEWNRSKIFSRVRLEPYDRMLLVSDHLPRRGTFLQPDHVIGVNLTSVTLESLTVRTPKNPRAMNFCEFNAKLNRLTNVECRQGDLFQPVEDCKFDLVVCNPPYVISPEASYLYRDSGLSGDAICREIVQRTPVYLEEGGYAHILCNWALTQQEDWTDPLATWLKDNGCDNWMLRYKTEDPLTYAAIWNRQIQASSENRFAMALDSWTSYYRQLGVVAIVSGAVIMRRRSSGRNWVRADDMPSGSIGSCSEHILRIFCGQDYLSEATDAQLMGSRFRLTEDHQMDQHLVPEGGRYVANDATLRMTQGIGFQGNVDSYGLFVLTRCDGDTDLRSIVHALSQATDVDLDALTQAVLPAVRKWLGLGFLLRVE